MVGPNDSDVWPATPNARWPLRCTIEGVALHPHRPWLALACTDAATQEGAVLVFDAQTGTLRSSTAFESNVGWSDDPNLLRWHPDGDRLTTNVDTNGIALLRRADVVGFAYPDETRDHGVRHVWIDHRIFTDTGALFEIREGDRRFEFDEVTSLAFGEMQWNAAIDAVVGTTAQGIAAYDPVREKVVYQTRFEAAPWRSGADWSADGRWYARMRWGKPGTSSDEVWIYNGDDGRCESKVVPSLPQIDATYWGPGGSLLVQCHSLTSTRAVAERRLDLVRNGRIETTIDLGPRRIEASHSIPEARGIAWSPSGDGIALLLDCQEIGILDARTGRILTTFPAPAPAIPPGLPNSYSSAHRPAFGFPGDLMWLAPQRLIRMAPHFVASWSIDGQEIAEFVVPTGC